MEAAIPLLVGIIFLVRLTATAASCPPEFEEMCRCGPVPYGPDKKLTYVTNCTDVGFDHTLMLRRMPPETQVLIFVGNEVKDLPLNIFGLESTYEQLHTIDLSNNHIQTIKGRTFHNVANVTKLVLNDNDLYIVSKDHHPRMFSNFANLEELHLRNAFTEKVKAGDYLSNLAEILATSSLTKLRVLDLAANEIPQLGCAHFCSLPALQELYLADNHLHDVPPLNFSCLPNLSVLDVANNLVPYLSDETLHSLAAAHTKLLRLNLTSNPFRCDCRLVPTYEWLVTTLAPMVDREQLVCASGFPPNLGKHLFAVPLDELQCLPEPGRRARSLVAAASVVGLLCLLLIAAVLGWRNRQGLSACGRRLLQPISSKFAYVSLDRRARRGPPTLDV